MTPRVLNATVKSDADDAVGAVYVGRPSKWGNPFQIGVSGSRAEVIDLYREYIGRRRDLIAALPELRGKNLICHCAPLPCHADVLLEMANDQS